MKISASMVKDLRERTGAGMMECKNALDAADGDIEAAIVALRKSGQAKAAKRAGKIAGEGLILLRVDEDKKTGFMVEVNCETDFVSRSDQFRAFANQVVEVGLVNKNQNEESLKETALANNQSVEQVKQHLVAQVGENINIRRATLLQSEGIVGGYLHGERIGVLVALDKANQQLAHDIAMHIAATNPLAIDNSSLSQSLIQKEREIFSAQAKESGKPEHIIEKMVEGRVEKYLQEVCLVNQPFVKNPDQTISEFLKANQAKVIAFTRYEVGEGIEKRELDFASEVKAQLQENT